MDKDGLWHRRLAWSAVGGAQVDDLAGESTQRVPKAHVQPTLGADRLRSPQPVTGPPCGFALLIANGVQRLRLCQEEISVCACGVVRLRACASTGCQGCAGTERQETKHDVENWAQMVLRQVLESISP